MEEFLIPDNKNMSSFSMNVSHFTKNFTFNSEKATNAVGSVSPDSGVLCSFWTICMCSCVLPD